jgi:hypothetical protein
MAAKLLSARQSAAARAASAVCGSAARAQSVSFLCRCRARWHIARRAQHGQERQGQTLSAQGMGANSIRKASAGHWP